MLKHKQRADKVRTFVDKNKLFTVTVIAVLFFLLGNLVHNKIETYEAIEAINKGETSISASSETTESVDTSIKQTEKEKPHWRFYWTDLWILVGGGGFCVIKIVQERKKAREKL